MTAAQLDIEDRRPPGGGSPPQDGEVGLGAIERHARHRGVHGERAMREYQAAAIELEDDAAFNNPERGWMDGSGIGLTDGATYEGGTSAARGRFVGAGVMLYALRNGAGGLSLIADLQAEGLLTLVGPAEAPSF